MKKIIFLSESHTTHTTSIMNEVFVNEDEKLFFREGQITYIRPLLKSDLRTMYLSWLNDPDLNKYSDHFRTWPTTEKDLEDFYNNEQKDQNNVTLAICCRKTGLHFGNHSFNNIDWINRTAQFNTNIGIKKYRSIHYIDSIKVILDYAFNTLNLNKVTGGAEIPGIMDFMKRFGFKQEGVLKNHFYRNGKYHDLVLFAIFKDDFLKLNK